MTDSDGNVVSTASNGADGSVTFDAISYSKVGTYEYTISENQGTATGITYDSSTYKAVVTVTDVSGSLVATISYDGDDVPTFTNTYTETSSSTSSSISSLSSTETSTSTSSSSSSSTETSTSTSSSSSSSTEISTSTSSSSSSNTGTRSSSVSPSTTVSSLSSDPSSSDGKKGRLPSTREVAGYFGISVGVILLGAAVYMSFKAKRE